MFGVGGACTVLASQGAVISELRIQALRSHKGITWTPNSTWVRFGVFHNTTDRMLQMGIVGTHSLYKNDLRLPKG